jgi:hypothetical protein
MLSVDMLNVAYNPSILSVVILNVNMLNVVAPSVEPSMIIFKLSIFDCHLVECFSAKSRSNNESTNYLNQRNPFLLETFLKIRKKIFKSFFFRFGDIGIFFFSTFAETILAQKKKNPFWKLNDPMI